jgi:hypothetical protein
MAGTATVRCKPRQQGAGPFRQVCYFTGTFRNNIHAMQCGAKNAGIKAQVAGSFRIGYCFD